MFDPTTEFGARVARRLREERIVWLTTVRADGLPQPSPVWFLWEGETVLIYSQPRTPKLRNIAGNARVSLALNADYWGNDVVIISGHAALDPATPPVHHHLAFVEKYRHALDSDEAAERMGRDYAVAIRVTPTALRGF